MIDPYHIFLSYSRNDSDAAVNLRAQLERHGLSLFKDDESIRAGDLWLEQLQTVLDHCSSFVVLVGRDGVRRWIGAETQAALNRYFGPHDDAERLPIFPILLDGTRPETFPPFLRLFQITPWNGTDPLPERLLDDIRDRTIVANETVPFEGCPFVGLAAYRPDQAQLFFGRQKETLDALTCFFDIRPGYPAVRWLEINGNSGSGKSSLMNAGLLPLVEKGWMWRPRSAYERWTPIGPMMPGERPVDMLAECLARAFKVEMDDVCQRIEADERGLARWLRSRKQDETAFLLAIDQFEELFTFADPDERRRFDRLLAGALEDADCPLFVISTVRADFLDRFGDLPRLAAVRNRAGRPWTLAPIGTDSLREVIAGPARLAGLDVSEVQAAMVVEARDEPGALPLVENALHWLWRERTNNRLSGRLFTEQAGLAGILSCSADGLLAGLDKQQPERALELLFRLVKVDPDARRHTRRRIRLAEAVDVAGGGERGSGLVYHLAGQRRRDGGTAEGPLRLITVTEEGDGCWVNLIHETLIRSKGPDAKGKPLPYWPTLWTYIEQHLKQAAWRERLKAGTQMWIDNQRRPSDLWSHERVREAVAALRQVSPELQLSAEEREFLGPLDPDAMLAELERSETTHRRRALIGERLCVLGDPRPGVMGIDANGTPDVDWCAVPGGEIIILVNGLFHDSGPKLCRKHVDSFHIARYPVTVAQYRTFLNAKDGWRNLQWWASDLYRDPEGDSYEFGRFANHPAVHVSWFDAVAFCRWLSRRLGFAVRLPDEGEWQEAAIGGDEQELKTRFVFPWGSVWPRREPKNVFPWGTEWDPKKEPHRANTFESGLCSTTAVGMYPAGVSPAGVLDMVGAVWEWCQNKCGQPEVTLSSASDFDGRALRGGSWFDPKEQADCFYPIKFRPLDRMGHVGFRVLCSSPIFGH